MSYYANYALEISSENKLDQSTMKLKLSRVDMHPPSAMCGPKW